MIIKTFISIQSGIIIGYIPFHLFVKYGKNINFKREHVNPLLYTCLGFGLAGGYKTYYLLTDWWQ